MTARPLLLLLLAACFTHAALADAPAPATASATAPAAAPATAPAPVVAAPAAAPAAPTVAAPIATPANPVAMPGSATPSAGSLLQTIFGLCVVLGLLAGLAWFLKRYGPRNATGSADLRIVGALNLGGRERIVVVEVGDQWVVVGASPGRINALATMPRQRDLAPQAQLADASPYAPSAGSFAEWLKQTIDKRK